MDARALGVLDRFPRRINITGHCAGERADDWALDLTGDLLDGFKVSGGACGKPGLDHVDTKFLELPRYPELFLRSQAGSG